MRRSQHFNIFLRFPPMAFVDKLTDTLQEYTRVGAHTQLQGRDQIMDN